ncbi:LCP family protein [Streptomyces meridianus]|uniref:LCP family protein n=1 Tax=Streptomyces meridianus TaxID=2938945 RepID=A0ABT0X9L8_9ACTN|nr:LCP family protein [Streptomyces meridianus]MCM2579217.1 LCP family protein [Streptomyces meridianus]
MDAQGRGRAGDYDPADQWVFDPNTGDYELRSNHTAGRQSPPAQRRASGRTHETPGRSRRRDVPSQRGRRGAVAPPPAGRRRPRPEKSGRKKALYWTGGITAFLLVAGTACAYAFMNHLDGNIDKVDVGMNNAASSNGPLNILVIGTDNRTGKNKGYGDAGSVGHADTTILFHVSKDRTNATALSIPRDMITDIPDCPTVQKDGSKKVIAGQQGVRFNTSLGQSGRDPGCTWRTVEKMTGVKINHFMMADFNAVKTLSTAVGGVPVCLTKDLNDPKSHLRLGAGRHKVKGEQALAFVRTRHAVGFGSDLDRIKLQQQFLSSMIKTMKSGDTLSSPSKLYDLANAATKALTVDTGIGKVGKLVDLAKDLKRVNLANISFVTVPVVDNTDGATVLLDKPKAEPIFSMVRNDVSLTEVKQKKKAAKDKQAELLEGPMAEPSAVRVEVLNGGGPLGAAQDTVDWLQNTEGVTRSSNGGNATGGKQDKTTLEFAPNQADQARRLADMMGLPASALKQGKEDAGPMENMTLVLGADFQAAGTPISAPTKAPKDVPQVRANDKNLCVR